MQLSDKAVRALKAKEKAYKVTDGQGLYVLVTAQGSRLAVRLSFSGLAPDLESEEIS